jgi:hypothetical protein
MAEFKNTKSRLEYGPGGAEAILANYNTGANPYFTHANMFQPDPRIPGSPIQTKTRNDQIAIAQAYEKSSSDVVARMKAKPDSFELEYKNVKSPIMMASVNIKEDKRKLEMLTPISHVLASNLNGSVCTTYTVELKEVPINPNDHETLVNKTNWEMTLSCRTVDNPETDGSSVNPLNWEFLKFTEDLRMFESTVIRMIAAKMIKTYDDDEGECKFLPELACSKEIRKAITSGNVDALAEEILKGPFVSVTRQGKLDADEQGLLKKKYKEKHGKWPTDDFVSENFTAFYGSDKLTIKTKQFQQSYGNNNNASAAPDMTGYPPLARAVCESKAGTKWIKPTVHRADGEGTIPYESCPVRQGDYVAVYFHPSFMVYKSNGQVKCGLTLQWTSDVLYYRKKREYTGSSNARATKKIKLSCADADVIQSMQAAVPAPQIPDLDDEEY